MKTSESPIILGSQNAYQKSQERDNVNSKDLTPPECNQNPNINYERNNCTDFTDYTITKLDIIDNTLIIYQNPRNIKKVKFASLEEYNKNYSELKKNKVEKTFNIKTGNGLHGGGNLTGVELEINIKPNNEHIHLDADGIYIEEFTNVTTSGTVPSPSKELKDSEHYLTANGKWVSIKNLIYKEEITPSTGFPDPTNLKTGMLYKIADLGGPDKTIEDAFTGDTYYSEDVLLWVENKWVVIGHATVKVNLGLIVNENSIDITNSNGNGVTLPIATEQKAGLISASEKTNFNSFNGIVSLNEVTNNEEGLNFSYSTRQLNSNIIENKAIVFPLATPQSNGILLAGDKKKLNNISENIVSNLNITYKDSELYLINTIKSIISGEETTSEFIIPESTYEEDNFKKGLISGENYKKLNSINLIITNLDYSFDAEQLKIDYELYDSNKLTTSNESITLPIATISTNGLLSKDDKAKLDKLVVMEQKQADFNMKNPDDVSFIKNKPSVLTTIGVEKSLIPSTLNIQNKSSKILNANGEWIDITLAKPVITVSESEPTDDNLKVDGAIWIKI